MEPSGSVGDSKWPARGRAPPTAETLANAGDLWTYVAGRRTNPQHSVILNRNNFLLADEDLAWLRATFPAERLTVFDEGGHMGNLANPLVQKSIVEALSGMGSTLPATKTTTGEIPP